MKGNKGITLIALIVTIIVLIILAGVAIAMLRGDNGILNRASEARYDTVLSTVDEQVKLAAVNVKTSITSQMVSKAGYIATLDTTADTTDVDPEYFTNLVEEVEQDLKPGDTPNIMSGFTVTSYLTEPSSTNSDGIGYILITYSDNALRSSLPTNASGYVTQTSFNGITYGLNYKTTVATGETAETGVSANLAVIAYVIKVTNYGSTLSAPVITTKAAVEAAQGITTKSAENFFSSTVSGQTVTESGTDLGKALL